MLDLKVNKSASKFLKQCENTIYKRIRERIKKLQEQPFPQDIKRVKGKKEKIFRIRIGDYRITYIIKKETLLIVDIDKRSRIYN